MVQVAREKLQKLSEQQLQSLKVDGEIMIMGLPSLQETHNMTEGQLLQTLKHCPLSATFGMSQDEIASNLSRVQMIVMIE